MNVGGGLAVTAGVLIIAAGGPPIWGAALLIGGVITIFASEGCFEDSHNPRKWIKGCVDSGIAAIPGGAAAKELTIFSKTPWILMKSGVISSGSKYLLRATVGGSFADGTEKVAKKCLKSYSLDAMEDKIMDYMGVPTYI